MRLADITGDLAIYFNWSCNAVMPVNPGAADVYLLRNKTVIERVAKQLIAPFYAAKHTLYRGLLLRKQVNQIEPQRYLQYLSFTTDKKVAEHFADVNGFGSDVINVSEQLGDYGYIIEYSPAPEEVLFHYNLFHVLPYAEVFQLAGLNGQAEVDGLRKQKEIMIYQPTEPFINIKSYNNDTSTRNLAEMHS